MKQNGYSKLVLTKTNELLQYLETMPSIPCSLPSIAEMTKYLEVSRTTIEKLFQILNKKGIIMYDERNKVVLRRPKSSDYFSNEDIKNEKSDIIEKKIIKLLSSYTLKPGDKFSELELARKLKSSTILTREVLLKIAQSGIIKKNPGQKWEVVEFSTSMINEITSIRKLYESFAIKHLESLSEDDKLWEKLSDLLTRHQTLLRREKKTAAELREIELDFHSTIINAVNNRFIEKSYSSLFTLIFFHLGQIEYDKIKIEKVLKQHLSIIRALLDKNFSNASGSMMSHLEHAKQSMIMVNKMLNKEQKPILNQK